jgi:NADH:ubiquinone oxidoreductase subunit 3 (subunit A)
MTAVCVSYITIIIIIIVVVVFDVSQLVQGNIIITRKKEAVKKAKVQIS